MHAVTLALIYVLSDFLSTRIKCETQQFHLNL